MDLVVGATGLVGQQIALGLRRKGRSVRALVRGGTHHEKAASLIAAGIEIVGADLTKPETLPAACAGMDTVLCTATSMPHGKDDGLRRVDHDGTLALIDSAESAPASNTSSTRLIPETFARTLCSKPPSAIAKSAFSAQKCVPRSFVPLTSWKFG